MILDWIVKNDVNCLRRAKKKTQQSVDIEVPLKLVAQPNFHLLCRKGRITKYTINFVITRSFVFSRRNSEPEMVNI